MLEMASLMNSSTLLKSYELLIQQFECDFEAKNARIRDVERELQQIQAENQTLAQHLYNVKSSALNAKLHDEAPSAPEGKRWDERDQLVELLKRNHDVIVEKYEMQRQHHDALEKNALDKERLYNEIKQENDQLANTNYKLQRSTEDLLNEKRILEVKLKNQEQGLRQSLEEARLFKLSNERNECQLKVVEEQLDSAKKSLEETSQKKQQELDIMNREISSLTLKERDAKQRAYLLEG